MMKKTSKKIPPPSNDTRIGLPQNDNTNNNGDELEIRKQTNNDDVIILTSARSNNSISSSRSKATQPRVSKNSQLTRTAVPRHFAILFSTKKQMRF